MSQPRITDHMRDPEKEAALEGVLDLVESWQNSGRKDLPIIQGNLLELLEIIVDDRRQENCTLCDGVGRLEMYEGEYWKCPSCKGSLS